MFEQVKQHLRPVRSRQYSMIVMRRSALGLLAGSALGLFLGVARLAGASLPTISIIGMALAGLFAGLVWGLVVRPSWNAAARAVDDHYRLKDRLLSALQFAQSERMTELHELQIDDALQHLRQLDARQVAPLSVPRVVPLAVVALIAAVAMVLVPTGSDKLQAEPMPPQPHLVQMAEELQETMIDELQRWSQELEEQDHPELDSLVAQLSELVEEMKQPGIDQREALARLSEMQAAILAAQSEFNMQAIEANLQALAQAMAAAKALQVPASALQKGDYNLAADQLEAVDPQEISRQEAETVARDLKELVESMNKAGQEQLRQATSEFRKGLQQDKPAQSQAGAKQLAQLARKYALRKAVSQSLANQLARLSECKGNSQTKGATSLAKRQRPSNRWGQNSAGNPLGEQATQLDSQRQQEKLTGMLGDGPSEREVTRSPEGRQQATRQYRESYQQFRKATEEVLQSEALPLGHRQTIRRYFEAIRPDAETQAAADTE